MIKVNNVSLKLKNKVILDDVSFEIQPKEIVGILGHNAAGKSTLHRFLANIEKLQSGTVQVNGLFNDMNVKNDCVLITEKLFLKPSLTIEQNFSLCNTNSLLNKSYFYERLADFKIDKHANFGSLSRGTKQIVNILLSFSKDAKVYIFDESLSSVDIFNRKLVSDLLLDAQERGATIIVTTHLINEFQMLFDRIIYLHEGKVTHSLTVDDIFEQGYDSIEDYIISTFEGGQ